MRITCEWGVSKLVLGFLVLRKCWEATGWWGGHWCSLGVCSLPAIQKITAVLLFASVGTMYGFFSLWKCGVFLSFPIPSELIYLFSFGAPRGDGLIIVIRLPCLPIHIISSILWSFKVWDCEPEWEEPPFGVSTLGLNLGQDHKRKQRWCDCGCCALWSVMHGSPAPGPPQRLAGAGAGAWRSGVGVVVLFSHFDWHHL